jgi:hypothetical protein
MNHPIAIINCHFITPDGEPAAGVILIVDGVIAAAGPDLTAPLPADTILLDAEKGRIAPDSDASIRPGAPADLVCRSRFGEVAWVMKAGVITYPPDAPPPPAPITWDQRRQNAITAVIAYLKKRPETVHIQQTNALIGFQKKGIDILWRFQAEKTEAQSLSIRVIPSLDAHPAHIFILDGPSARKLPTASLSATSAHWWFYHHGSDNALYCFPTPTLRKWMDSYAKEIPPTSVRAAGVAFPLSGRAIPVERLQGGIKRTRIIRL